MQEYAVAAVDGFERSWAVFTQFVADLESPGLGAVTHADLEERLLESHRELVRVMLQDHLDLRAAREVRVPGGVTGPDGLARPRAEAGRKRRLVSVFGPVTVSRIVYRSPGLANVCPADAILNLPSGSSFSHGIRRLAVIESVRGSFAGASEAIARATGVKVATRQVRDLTQRAGIDAQAFYGARPPMKAAPQDVLVLTADGKGVVMRPGSLREATARKAARAAADGPRLASRLSPGEKNGRKRMAELACVHDIAPQPRTADDVLTRKPDRQTDRQPNQASTGNAADPSAKRPRATGKWLDASLIKDIPVIVAEAFEEAERRDPTHQRTWVALVDGNRPQITAIQTEATRRGVTVTILIDLIHVMEYVWSAAWSFFDKADPDAQDWVTATTRKILQGKALAVAAGLRRRATRFGFTGTERKNADIAATYLTSHAAYLDYPTALTGGWPIATGVFEGACRHLVKDRMDITGARWGLAGAETILTLRALTTTGHLDDYWTYHLAQEHQRNYPPSNEKAAA